MDRAKVVDKEAQTGSVKRKDPTFTKDQIVKSKKYANKRDALNALLKSDVKYSFKQVDELLEKFYKGGSK